MDLRRTSSPLTQQQKLAVVSLAKAKQQARVSHSFEDELLSDYVEAAYDFLSGTNGWLNQCFLLTETFELYLPSWYPVCTGRGADTLRRFELPARPFVSLSAFEWLQSDGSYAALPASSYAVSRSEGAFAKVSRISITWPYAGAGTPLAYRLTFQAGFGAAADIPMPLKQCILLLVAEFYDNRTASADQIKTQTLYGLQKLAGPYRLAKDHS